MRSLANNLLKKPHVVELADASPASTIDHALVLVSEERKRALLEHVLATEECRSAIVFTRTKHRARRLAEQLTKAGHRAVGLQGGISPRPSGTGPCAASAPAVTMCWWRPTSRPAASMSAVSPT
ncbi:MAG: DEAD/DEAH box helicase [Acidobacteriota bacterium]|nr:DEAD/DEAH box helicase [Acidobacteriota bacterium]